MHVLDAISVSRAALRESSSLSSLAIASEHELGVLRQQFSRDLFDVVFGMVDFVHKQLATVVALREKVRTQHTRVCISQHYCSY